MKIKHRMKKDGKPTLSILVLSSGREKTIERCLKSFDAIKQVVYTEIIVVDTDKTRNRTVYATLKKYADKIVTFKWCDDFSAARNAGLKAVNGKWLLYVDDDEWIINAKPIIKFLASGEHLGYHWCNLIARNYVNTGMTEYSDTWVSRMCKIIPDTTFHGIIHESFEPLIGDAKVLDAVIGHSGYVFATEEANKAHSKRNIALLEKAIADDPKNTRLWVQIVQEYGALKDYDTQRRLCNTYIGISQKIKLNPRNERYIRNLQGLFVGCRVRIEVMTKKWQQARVFYNKYAKTSDYGVVPDGFLALMGVILFYNLGDFARSQKACRVWLENFSKYKKAPADYAEDEVYFLGEAFDDNAVKTVGVILELINKYQTERNSVG